MLSRKTKDKIKRKIEFIKLFLSSETNHLKKDVSLKKKWFGNDYGGFLVATEFLNKDSIVYSFGVGEDISFDTEIIDKYNCMVFGFDPTPKSINWVKSNQLSQNFKFFDFGIGDTTKTDFFYFPKNPDFVSGSTVEQSNINLDRKIEVQLKTLNDTMSLLEHKKVDVLKMDIEGAEYKVLENILNSDIEIGQILVEFHDRFFPNGKQKTIDILEKLKEHGFLIFGISETYDEISLINKNLIKSK
ncbi:FkbM family methyltransferase [Chryseobacterium sp. ERMR1:04]|uniref:FkbM family methyltransferase n=1 Tax=Chryseobacterium sp. ERMR1:04 TaxID=1705393 RepID=UPI0006C85FEC|nr:FkbM family methyltransferase [Chryseobacterium sp. ERMR1:04]